MRAPNIVLVLAALIALTGVLWGIWTDPLVSTSKALILTGIALFACGLIWAFIRVARD